MSRAADTSTSKLKDVIVALQSDKRALIEERSALLTKAQEHAARAQALSQALEAQRASSARGSAAASALQAQVDQLHAQKGALSAELQVRLYLQRGAAAAAAAGGRGGGGGGGGHPTRSPPA
jgi:hypothetical protein